MSTTSFHPPAYLLTPSFPSDTGENVTQVSTSLQTPLSVSLSPNPISAPSPQHAALPASLKTASGSTPKHKTFPAPAKLLVFLSFAHSEQNSNPRILIYQNYPPSQSTLFPKTTSPLLLVLLVQLRDSQPWFARSRTYINSHNLLLSSASSPDRVPEAHVGVCLVDMSHGRWDLTHLELIPSLFKSHHHLTGPPSVQPFSSSAPPKKA